MPIKHPRFVSILFVAVLLASLLLGVSRPAGAQTGEPLAPPEIPGEVVYVPFPVAIQLDGNLDDWQSIPVQVVTQGTSPSKTAGEDGPLSFAVAADNENFYLMMSIPDRNIITGQHGTDFWNEDSLEFYLNTSGDLNAAAFGDGIFQVNINPGDIGNTDPARLTLSGTNNQQAGVRAFVFKTADGWGIEAAVPLTVQPEHGLEIGFQAQANGASEQNRNVKLIWSNADVGDNSWQYPYLFGRAMFLEVGRTDIPETTERGTPPTATPPPTPVPARQRISVNQTGYLPYAPKHAAYGSQVATPLTWRLLDSQGSSLLEGKTTPFGYDAAAGDNLQVIDFSAFTTPGAGYTLQVGELKSDPFDISADIYEELPKQTLNYFYLNRSGVPIEAQYAPGPEWARPAGHLSDEQVTCYQGADASGTNWPGCDYTLNAAGGWYDAGDYGKYVVNGGISVWTLLNLYERNPQGFPDGSLSLPENQNGVPDLLDEARWELEFLLGMQVPDGQPLAGMAHHKLHGEKWDPMPSAPPESSTADGPDGGRYLFPPSTAATLNLAATAAQCARIWETIDRAFSARCLTAAETAWQAASANPNIAAAFFDAGGGAYEDANFADEFYWAASELYVTTGEDVYKDFLLAPDHFADTNNLFWGATAGLGVISLATVPNGLPADKIEQSRQSVIASADEFVQTLDGQGYRVPLAPGGYAWGSNSDVLNRMMMMGLAYDFTQDPVYLNSLSDSMDYLLGRNPLNKSYVSGYGEDPLQHPHHRFWADQPDQGYPPVPPGAVAGGPNGSPSDPATEEAGLIGNPPAKSYLDDYDSFSTNEVAINWNAPLAWVAAYLNDTARPILSEEPAAAAAPTETVPSSSVTPTPAADAAAASETQPTPGWAAILGGALVLALIAVAVVIWRRRRSAR